MLKALILVLLLVAACGSFALRLIGRRSPEHEESIAGASVAAERALLALALGLTAYVVVATSDPLRIVVSGLIGLMALYEAVRAVATVYVLLRRPQSLAD